MGVSHARCDSGHRRLTPGPSPRRSGAERGGSMLPLVEDQHRLKIPRVGDVVHLELARDHSKRHRRFTPRIDVRRLKMLLQ